MKSAMSENASTSQRREFSFWQIERMQARLHAYREGGGRARTRKRLSYRDLEKATAGSRGIKVSDDSLRRFLAWKRPNRLEPASGAGDNVRAQSPGPPDHQVLQGICDFLIREGRLSPRELDEEPPALYAPIAMREYIKHIEGVRDRPYELLEGDYEHKMDRGADVTTITLAIRYMPQEAYYEVEWCRIKKIGSTVALDKRFPGWGVGLADGRVMFFVSDEYKKKIDLYYLSIATVGSVDPAAPASEYVVRELTLHAYENSDERFCTPDGAPQFLGEDRLFKMPRVD